MNKSALREIYLNKRKEFSDQEIDSISQKILANLLSLNIWENSVYHIFVPIPNRNEINTIPIQNYLLDQHKTLVVPKIEGVEMLSCKINENTEWIKGKFNVPEPKTCEILDPSLIEVVFVPMLICDKSGNRVGYGGGFYDRFLAKCKPNVLKIGLNFFSPIPDLIEAEEFDIPLDYCVTASEIVSFTT